MSTTRRPKPRPADAPLPMLTGFTEAQQTEIAAFAAADPFFTGTTVEALVRHIARGLDDGSDDCGSASENAYDLLTCSYAERLQHDTALALIEAGHSYNFATSKD